MQWHFTFPLALQLGLPLALGILAYATYRQRDRYGTRGRVIALTALRVTALVLAVALIAAPMYVESQEDLPRRRGVVVLVDRSQSMALEEEGTRRFRQSLDFMRDKLLPALRRVELEPTAMAFADEAMVVTGEQLASSEPDGRRTNLGRALLRAVSETDPPPRAIFVLTDGAANDAAENQRAMGALIENRIPVAGIGFGSEAGPRSLTVQSVEAPPSAPPKQRFRVTASLESGGVGEIPAFDLLLLRDGQFVERKTVEAGPAGRVWLEGFEVAEEEAGIYRYTVQCAPLADASVRMLDGSATAAVRVADEKDLRVLFVQGALTWDYKFIRIALLSDPAIRMTGLSRTSTSSVFYQNIEDSDELKAGFPTKVEQLAPFSVVVLANLRHTDLTPAQQETLARFCGEFGGGVLMIGGPETFDASWRDSRLEQLLAVRFAAVGTMPTESPFALRLTPEGLASPVFRLGDAEDPATSWARLPPFMNYARVDSVKPGAEVWATHPQDRTQEGERALIAAQRFGSGRSAVIAVQNFWRWRLARDSDPKAFDRFWQQLLRHLAEGGREQVSILLADQALEPGGTVRLSIQRQPDPREPVGEPKQYVMLVTNDQQVEVARQNVEVAANQSAPASFRTAVAGGYRIEIRNAQDLPVAQRSIEIRDINQEWRRPARDMRQLEQWAAITHGLAEKVESCGDVDELVARVVERAEEAARSLPRREPAGLNGWTFAILLGCLGAEWLLRKHWGLP